MKHNTKRKNRNMKNKTQKQFLFNPKNPSKSFDVYIDKNPKNTIHIKYTTTEDVKNTIEKLEKLYKIKNIAINEYGKLIMYVRLKVLRSKKPEQFALANKYFHFLGKRTKLSEKDRYHISFKYV